MSAPAAEVLPPFGEMVETIHHHWAWIFARAFPGFEWLAVSMVVIAGLTLLAALATGDLALEPKGMQNVAEMIYEQLEGFVTGMTGEMGRPYVPFIGTIFIYIFSMNLIGLVPGFVSPTSDLNITAAMAITVFVSVQCIAVSHLGLKNYVLHLCGEPLWMFPLMFPIHVIGELAKPLSLALRLFGNIYGEDQVVLNLTALSLLILRAIHLPIPLQLPLMAFGIFTSFVQALVFSMLATIYIVLFIAGHHEAHESEHGVAAGGHH